MRGSSWPRHAVVMLDRRSFAGWNINVQNAEPTFLGSCIRLKDAERMSTFCRVVSVIFCRLSLVDTSSEQLVMPKSYSCTVHISFSDGHHMTNNKLLGTSASLLVTSALLVVTRS